MKCRHVVENKCDLVNCSFGEPMSYSNAGPALAAIDDVVERYGVIFCSSAGNDGPGIETGTLFFFVMKKVALLKPVPCLVFLF